MRRGRRLFQKHEGAATYGGNRNRQRDESFERVRFHCEQLSERQLPWGVCRHIMAGVK